MKTLYVKYSSARNDRFNIVTSILRDDNGRQIVRKEAISKEGLPHIAQIYNNACALADGQKILSLPSCSLDSEHFDSEYVPGTTLDKEIRSAIAHKDRKQFLEMFDSYKKILLSFPSVTCNPSQSPDFLAKFGMCDQSFLCMKLGCVDMIPENIVRAEDQSLWAIDPEWFVDGPIPVDFVLFRAASISILHGGETLASLISEEELLSHLGILENRSLFRKWEDLYTTSIYEGGMYSLQNPFLLPVNSFDTWEHNIPQTVRSSVYYGVTDYLSEEKCVRKEIRTKREISITYLLSEPTMIRNIRWDPCEDAHLALRACKITLSNRDEEVASSSSFQTNAGIVEDLFWGFLTLDPQIHFSFDRTITIDKISVSAVIEWCSYDSMQEHLLVPAQRRIWTMQHERNQAWEETRKTQEVVTQTQELVTQTQDLVTQTQDSLTKTQEALNECNEEVKRLKKEVLSGKQQAADAEFRHLHQSRILQDTKAKLQRTKQSKAVKLVFPIRFIMKKARILRNPLNGLTSLPQTAGHSLLPTQAGTLQVIGDDPQLITQGHYKAGLYLFSWDAAAKKRALLKLYPDYGKGISELESRPLGYITTIFSHHEHFFYLHSDASMIRMDPGEGGENELSIVSFNYMRLGIFSAIRVGLSLISAQTHFPRYRLLGHFAKLCLTGKKREAMGAFSNAFRAHGAEISSADENDAYQQYVEDTRLSEDMIEQQSRAAAVFAYQPVISVIVPVYNTNESMLIDMIESVRSQTYEKWELCLADGHSQKEHVAPVLERYAQMDSRIKIKLLSENLGIAGNTNEALALATGAYISLLDHDDLLSVNALFEVVKAINENNRPEVIYSDEDKITFDGKKRFFPHFKPDWSPDLLRSYNYITHLFTAKRDLVAQVGNFLPGYDGSQDHDLILRTTERAKNIVHIPLILYHWRSHSESTAENQGNKSYTLDAGVRAISAHLKRVGYEGTVSYDARYGFYHVDYKLVETPLVSIIIPNYEHYEDLHRCIESIYSLSTYKNFEVIVVENNSKSKEIFEYYEEIKEKYGVKVITWPDAFNYSAINNFAVTHSSGKYLLFLNNDTEVISPDYMEQLLSYAQRTDVGAVGARLYYPDDTIQHAGVVLGFQGIAGHAFSRISKEDPGYMARAFVVADVSAVTAACMMLARKTFDEISGFDESLCVAFNDIDLCMKILDTGRYNVYNPGAELYHHESVSRGAEDTDEKRERFASEIACFKDKWGDKLSAGDPYYNPHLDLEKVPFRISGK